MIVIKIYWALIMKDEKLKNHSLEQSGNHSLKSNIVPEHINNSEKTTRKRGRPKCFNEQHALEKAMLLFWKYGYEGTSISNLTQALGITAPSLYSSFGDKAQLFQKCLDYYIEHEACSMPDIFAQADTPKVAIELLLRDNLNRLIQAQKPTGCMLVVATMNCSEENKSIQDNLRLRRQDTQATLLAYLERAQQDMKLPKSLNVELITNFYATILQGMTIQARDGASFEQLNQVVEQAIQCWDTFK